MRWLAYLAGRRLVSLLAVAMGALIFSAPALAKPPPPPPDWIASYLNSVSVQVPHCSTPLLSQPFKNWKDMAYYTPAPGQSAAGFTGDDWLLLDGASVKPGTFDDGAVGHVLDLPSGSLAISPPMCVTADYPKARTMIRSLVGGGGVAFFVTYAGTSTWGKPRNGGNAHGKDKRWSLSDPIKVQPSKAPGWQIVRFALVPSGKASDFRLYNFYVDPYAKG